MASSEQVHHITALSPPSEPGRHATNEALAEVHFLSPDELSEQASNHNPGGNITLLHGYAPVESARTPVPYTLAIPEYPRIAATAVIVPGFCAIKRTSRELRNELAYQGIPTVSYNPARVHSSRKDWLHHAVNPQRLHYDTLAAVDRDIRLSIEQAKVPEGIQISNAKRILIAHSMGNLAAIDFAVDHPMRVDSLVSIGGAGMEEPLGLKLVARTKDVVLRDVAAAALTGKFKGYGLKVATNTIHYVARNPVRTAAEVISCTVADKRQAVERLAELGVRQVVFCPMNDDFFYPEDTIKAVGEAVDYWEIIENLQHTGPQTQARRVAQIISPAIINR